MDSLKRTILFLVVTILMGMTVAAENSAASYGLLKGRVLDM